MKYSFPISCHSIKLKENQSKFFGLLKPIDTGEEFKTWLSYLRKEYHSAAHICWAYRIINDQNVVEHSSDAGEPTGSAGLPIANSLKRSGVINVGLAVVRYFGGKKLGKRRLIEIYGNVAKKVIGSSSLKIWIDWCKYSITGPLECYGELSTGIIQLGGKIILDNSIDHLSLHARIPRSKTSELIILIRNATQGQGELELTE